MLVDSHFICSKFGAGLFRRTTAAIFAACLGFAFAPGAQAALICRESQAIGAEWRISSRHFGDHQGMTSLIPPRFQVLIWNVYKNNRRGLLKDLSSMSGNADLTLLQEAVDHPVFVQSVMQIKGGQQWQMALAFERGGVSTGVATGSKARPVRIQSYRSAPTEPITGTPKSMILSEYRLAQRQETLLVLNVHAINFVSLGSFQKHVDQMADLVSSHRGPILVAGDFNTWSAKRLAYLNARLGELGIEPIDVARDHGFLTLDHVYSRGLNVQMANDVPNITSSDHKPIYLEFSYALSDPS